MDDLVCLMMIDMTTKDDSWWWWYFDPCEKASQISRIDEGETMLSKKVKNRRAVVDGT
jgi:hypothetical protein